MRKSKGHTKSKVNQLTYKFLYTCPSRGASIFLPAAVSLLAGSWSSVSSRTSFTPQLGIGVGAPLVLVVVLVLMSSGGAGGAVVAHLHHYRTGGPVQKRLVLRMKELELR